MNPVEIYDDRVVINASEYLKHDGYVHRIGSLSRSLYVLKSDIGSKNIVFQFLDGEPLRSVSFDRILETILQNQSYVKNRISFELIDHEPRFCSSVIDIKIQHNPFFKQAQDFVKVDCCLRDNNSKLFGGFFGRFTSHRFLMAYFLETQHKNDSIVAFHPDARWIEFEFYPVSHFFDKELTWLKTRTESVANLPSSSDGCLPTDGTVFREYHNIFSLFQIEVIIETNVFDMGWFTEKTTKCLAAGKPFLLFGTLGQLQKLRDMGFRTFDGVINESYDLESNLEKRFDMICAEIDRLARLSPRVRSAIVDELYKISEHNKINYKEIIDRYYQQELS